MKMTLILPAAVLVPLLLDPAAGSADPKDEISIKELPPFYLDADEYRAGPYLDAARKLRALGKEKAVKMLQAAAEDSEGGVVILCRMLFTAKPKSTFRRPWIGAPSVLGGTKAEDWPLEPIEIVDGVPFLVVRGYSLGGLPESVEHYLNYCLKECDWGTAEVKALTAEERKKALGKLLSSKKWKTPLTDDEKAFLAAQIK